MERDIKKMIVKTAHNKRISGYVPSALRPNSPFGRTSDMRQPLAAII